MTKQIKYSYISRNTVRLIFWVGCIIGATMWSTCGGLAAAEPMNNLYPGLRDAGLVLLSGTIAFCAGMLVKVKEETL